VARKADPEFWEQVKGEITAGDKGRAPRPVVGPQVPARGPRILALQLQGSPEVSPLRHGLMASPPDRPRDDERGLDPTLG
jgi:hypothetical protein